MRRARRNRNRIDPHGGEIERLGARTRERLEEETRAQHGDRERVPDPLRHREGLQREPFNFTPMAVNSVSSGSPHVRPMGVHRTCGEPDEIKKNTHPKHFTALFRERTVKPWKRSATDCSGWPGGRTPRDTQRHRSRKIPPSATTTKTGGNASWIACHGTPAREKER